MGSLIAIGLPLLSTLIPLLLHKNADGSSPVSGILSTLGGLFKNVTSSPSSTATGAVGSGVLAAVMASFPCVGNVTNWQNLAIAAVPLIFGALTQDKGKVPVAPLA